MKVFSFFIICVMIFCLIVPGEILGVGTRGSKVKVKKNDFSEVSGELLRVGDNQLVLMSDSEVGITVKFDDIRILKLRKKGSFWTGAAVTMGLSVAAGVIYNRKYNINDGGSPVIAGLFIGIPSSLLIGWVTAKTHRYKTYKFDRLTPEARAEVLEKLERSSRFFKENNR